MRTRTTSWSSRLTMMHELIDREDPRCLYCHSECDIEQDGTSISLYSSGDTYECQILTCRKCKEVFEIHWYDHSGDIFYHAFLFTCKELTVFDFYPRPTDMEEHFAIGTRDQLYKQWKDDPRNFPRKNRVPAFPVDFFNKRALHKKLKTYLTFS